MNFPDTPLFRVIYWIINTAGIGGVIVFLVAGGLLTAFAITLYWIARGAQVDELETYTFPTPTLLGHKETHE